MQSMHDAKLAERARKMIGTRIRGSLKWERVEPDRYLYVRGIHVPHRMVAGGRADIEAHTDKDGKITEVYLVA